MHHHPAPRDIYRLAAEASIDPRTARKALNEGVGVIRGDLVRERIERAMRVLGLSAQRERATTR